MASFLDLEVMNGLPLYNFLLPVAVIVLFRYYSYAILARYVTLVVRTYFRKIDIEGINHFPREGPVIVCPNHPNMFCDPLVALTAIFHLGRAPYVWAKASLFKNPIIGYILQSLGAVPVTRPPSKDPKAVQDKDTEKTSDQIAEETKRMFRRTWETLDKDHCLVLFPEGTSYTQPHMLDLRTGVIRVAIGYAQNYDREIPIVPCGLTYFRKDKFRSDVLVDFGTPLVISPKLVNSPEFKANEAAEVKRLTKQLQDLMYGVTLNAPDFETLQLAHVALRLYLKDTWSLSARDEVRLSREFVKGYSMWAESGFKGIDGVSDNEVLELREAVKAYSKALKDLHVSDRYIASPDAPTTSLYATIIKRLLYLFVILPLGVPGLLLHLPIYFIGKKVIKVAGWTESISMFKIFANSLWINFEWSLVLVMVYYYYGVAAAQIALIALPVLLISHIRILEEGRSVAESIRHLFKVASRDKRIQDLREIRSILAGRVQKVVNAYVSKETREDFEKTAKKAQKSNMLAREASRSDFLENGE